MSYTGAAVAIVSVVMMLASHQRETKQLPLPGTFGGFVRVVSATVVAMWQASGTSAGPAALKYLVLWRGQPRIQNQDITLGDSDVILVEHADDAAKTKVVRTLRVDGSMPDGNDRADVIVRKVPELIEFLQCTVRLPNAKPGQQKIVDSTCQRFTKSD